MPRPGKRRQIGRPKRRTKKEAEKKKDQSSSSQTILDHYSYAAELRYVHFDHFFYPAGLKSSGDIRLKKKKKKKKDVCLLF